MRQLKCEICGSADLVKQEGAFTCQTCGVKYSAEEARRMLSGDEIQSEQNVTTPEEESDDEVVKIPIVELFDESGEKIVFELLDTIEFEDDRYPVLTPYYETAEEYNLYEPANVFIMKEVIDNATNEPMLETVEDEVLLQSVYDVFKSKFGNEYEFRDK